MLPEYMLISSGKRMNKTHLIALLGQKALILCLNKEYYHQNLVLLYPKQRTEGLFSLSIILVIQWSAQPMKKHPLLTQLVLIKLRLTSLFLNLSRSLEKVMITKIIWSLLGLVSGHLLKKQKRIK
jgi:hypothetical protein